MTNVFPTSNLPTVSQPWGREVQKRVETLESQFSLQRTNSATVDAQLQSSYRRLDGAVIGLAAADVAIEAALVQANSASADAKSAADQALAAINGLTGLGSTGSGFTINADNIKAGTISGITFNTTGGTESLTISSGRINFFEGGSGIGNITADTDGSNDFIQIQSSTGVGSLTVGSDYSVLSGSNCAVQPGVAQSGRIDLTATTVFCNADFLINGDYTVSGVAQAIIGPGGGVYPTNGTQTGTANVIQDASSAILRRVSSARRYKLDIQDVDYGLKALNLRPRTWIDKTLYQENGNSSDGLVRIPGFVAEEVYEAGLNELVKFNEDGEVESLHYDRMIGALIPVMQHQQNLIQELTLRIETLENGATNG